MKNTLLLLFLFPLLSMAQIDSICTLHAHIAGLGNKTIIFSHYTSDPDKAYTEVKVKGHHDDLTFTAHLSEPTYYRIYYFKKKTKHHKSIYHSVEAFLENATMTLTGQLDSLDKATITGSPLNVEWNTVQKIALFKSDSLHKAKAALAVKDSTHKKHMLSPEEMKPYNDYISTYITTHPASYISMQLITYLYSYNVQPKISLPLYNALNPQIQNSTQGIIFKRKLDVALKTDVGLPAPDITLPDADGKNISLSSFHGKLTLLDFWASWCGPCRKENPNLVKAYHTYHDKGFDIYSVSLDTKKEAWKEAIAKDSLSWTHVCDLIGWKSPAAQQYGIQAIPGNVLIDKNGIIIAKNLREDQLEIKLKELIGQ